MAKSNLVYIVVFCIGTLGAGHADAGGPNHSDSVCNGTGLVGTAYATCHRYCDALDCDSASPNASDRACERALDRFLELTGEVPPCEPACPCASGWLAEDFIPEGEMAGECYVQITDLGVVIDVQLEGGPDANGAYPRSFAATDILNDFDGAYHRIGCLSEHFADQGAPLSEDSGSYDTQNLFREPTKRFLDQQRKQFESCEQILQQIVDKLDIECTRLDLRTE